MATPGHKSINALSKHGKHVFLDSLCFIMSTGWIISFVVAVVAICAGLAAFGFRGRITTVGIDLGTTFSVVGINKNGKIIIIEDDVGHKIFPSVVSYQDNGDILTAYEALPYVVVSDNIGSNIRDK